MMVCVIGMSANAFWKLTMVKANGFSRLNVHSWQQILFKDLYVPILILVKQVTIATHTYQYLRAYFSAEPERRPLDMLKVNVPINENFTLIDLPQVNPMHNPAIIQVKYGLYWVEDEKRWDIYHIRTLSFRVPRIDGTKLSPTGQNTFGLKILKHLSDVNVEPLDIKHWRIYISNFSQR
ncbi:hypothetical protein [Parasitella parasitica]|uniref:Uncharacterized protein n=1 Tax=Parasitella parasitica TaxID=35722 RepID=A0A0B7MUT2_9FUNG|nr:hypothetical protein [Parasitella parasitica]